MNNPSCDYPSCQQPVAGSRMLIVTPEPIAVNLCAKHEAIVDSNQSSPETVDFWRWFTAMSGMGG